VSDIEKFNFDGTEVRTVMEDGEPWFVARDVTDVLGFTNGSKAVRDHVLPGQTHKERIVMDGGVIPHREVTVISEPGLYRLIMRSNVPDATRFQAWVTDEVLPTIRKTGGAYITPGSQAELDLTDPDTALDKLIEIAQVAKEARAKVRALEAKATEDAPYTEWARDMIDTSGLVSFTKAAKELGLKPRSEFLPLVRQWGWIYSHSTIPTAYGLDRGYVKTVVYDELDKPSGKLTAKGFDRALIKIRKGA